MDRLTPHYLHYFDKYPRSFALIAAHEGCRAAAVFVHGFGGNSTDTWSNLHLMIDHDNRFASAFADLDLFFLNYPSVLEGVGSSVNRLKQFLGDLVPTPDPILFEVDTRPLHVEGAAEEPDHLVCVLPGTRRYQDLVLVGHSEGAVVIRTLLAELAGEVYELALMCRQAGIVLFAPALFGYAPAGILGFVANAPVLGDLIDAALRISPAYRDLQPEKKTLEKLQQVTERLARARSGRAYMASLLWGRRDRIVQDGKYHGDVSDYRDGHGHVSICKSTPDYGDPMTLIDSLRRRP